MTVPAIKAAASASTAIATAIRLLILWGLRVMVMLLSVALTELEGA